MDEFKLENLKKRLIMRAEHRGMKEMDIILGRFVRTNIDQFDLNDINEIEALMDENDQLLYAMITGHEKVNPKYESWIERLTTFSKTMSI